MEPVFGSQHKRALATIAHAHEQVRADAEPRMVALVGDTGTGKTFLVQHFYHQLARDQRYWPPDIHHSDRAAVSEVLAARGVVDPGTFNVAPGAEIPWFWWGLRCLRPDGARWPVDALNEGASQLAAHLGPLLLRRKLRREVRRGLQQIIVSGVVSAVPVLSFVEAARQAGHGVYNLVKAAYEAHQSRGAATGGAAAGADPVAHDEEAARSLGDSHRALLSPDLPMILVVDDAHDADRRTRLFVEELLASRVPVLVVWCQHPPAHPSGDAPDLAATVDASWYRRRVAVHGDRVHLCGLRRFTKPSPHQLMQSRLPKVPPAVIAKVIERVGTNPLALRLMAEWLEQECDSQGRLRLDVHDLEQLPATPWDVLELQWRSLDAATKTGLAVGAQQGLSFLVQPVEQACGLVGVHNVTVSIDRTRGRNVGVLPHHSVVRSFAEPAAFELALDAFRHLVKLRGQRNEVIKAQIESVGQLRSPGTWDALREEVKLTALRAHVRLTGSAAEPDYAPAATSARELAWLTTQRNQWETAHELHTLALDWHERAEGTQGPDRAGYLEGLARSFEDLGRFREAAPLRSQVVGLLGVTGQPCDRALLRARLAHAACLRRTGQGSSVQAARDLLTAVAGEFRECFGQEDADAIEALHQLGLAHQDLGDYERAVALRRLVLCLRVRTGGGIEDPDVQRALAMLSYAYTGLAREHAREARFARDRGEHDRAEQLAETAGAMHSRALRGRRTLVDVRRRALGPAHPETLRAQLNLAASHAYLGEHEEALRLRRNVKRQRARFLQPTHPDYLSALSAWAKSLSDSSRTLPPARRRQRLRQAADALQEVLDRRLELYGRTHKAVARAAATLARVYEDLDRPGEAVELRRLVLEQREAQRARDHSEVRLAASKLAAALEASGQAVEAGVVQRDYLDG